MKKCDLTTNINIVSNSNSDIESTPDDDFSQTTSDSEINSLGNLTSVASFNEPDDSLVVSKESPNRVAESTMQMNSIEEEEEEEEIQGYGQNIDSK